VAASVTLSPPTSIKIQVCIRERRLSGEWNQKGKKKLSEATVNRESYLHAVFSEMKRLGEWEGR
jgi:hypothetical protein